MADILLEAGHDGGSSSAADHQILPSGWRSGCRPYTHDPYSVWPRYVRARRCARETGLSEIEIAGRTAIRGRATTPVPRAGAIAAAAVAHRPYQTRPVTPAPSPVPWSALLSVTRARHAGLRHRGTGRLRRQTSADRGDETFNQIKAPRLAPSRAFWSPTARRWNTVKS